MSRLAWVDNDRQIVVGDASGMGALRLSGPISSTLGAWGAPARSSVVWSWPTWSPDGRWIAAFGVEAGDERAGPLRIDAFSVDGVQQELWYEAPNVAPIYLQWHPGGQALSVLLQRGEELALGLVSRKSLGRMKQVEVGVPLFFNWVPSGDRILLHVGDRGERTARLVLRDPFGPTEDVPYPRQPGSFCAPVFAAGRAAYAVAGEGHSRVVASGLDGGEPCDLLTANGLAAVVGAPGGRPWVAVSVADKGEGSPYRGIHLVNVHDGTRRRITDIDCMAFFWSPTGDWLLAAQVVADENCLRWWRVGVDGGQPLDLGTFWPTRDVLFYLHFFDQYTMSHPLVSPCGRWVSWAGYPAGGGHADLSNPPRIFVKRADGGGEAEDIAGGVFSVWSSG